MRVTIEFANKRGHCVCGKKLTECRDECCDATLRALAGEWIRPTLKVRQRNTLDCEVCGFEHYERPVRHGVVRGWSSISPFELMDPASIWQMAVIVGGFYADKGERPYVYLDAPRRQRVYGDTPEDAVINAYAVRVDNRAEVD